MMTLMVLLTLQILLEDYFNIMDVVFGPLEDSDDMKLY